MNGGGPEKDFQDQVERKRPHLLGEFLAFLKSNKKWWLLPVLAVFFLIGIFLLLSTTGLAPLIYPLF